MNKKNRSINYLNRFKCYFKDKYTRDAHERKIRSRSWFKLEEIDRIDNIITNKKHIVDLGSYPGGWSQYIAKKTILQKNREIIAIDITFMKPIEGVSFIQGDVMKQEFLDSFLGYLKKKPIDLLVSDMAPKTTGIASIDVSKSIYLAQLAFSIAKIVLINSGCFLVKVFQGDGFDAYLRTIRSYFSSVKIRKPKSSRSYSREVFIVAGNKKK
ncbi:Ribosomal RNA large subunit methyltransferase E [Buchnera aphidicola (Thelaxes suberi)]|uniref:RlmE family RNA methyltransferase n=1 Tax=Buchnera aphidicola TaxID=9 RepID=UPI003464E65D